MQVCSKEVNNYLELLDPGIKTEEGNRQGDAPEKPMSGNEENNRTETEELPSFHFSPMKVRRSDSSLRAAPAPFRAGNLRLRKGTYQSRLPPERRQGW